MSSGTLGVWQFPKGIDLHCCDFSALESDERLTFQPVGPFPLSFVASNVNTGLFHSGVVAKFG
jgi:hypothetical protein